jgi:MSHA biogenesis protein MshN
MSLINQMLLDLDKRRASTSERSELPNQIRVLPPLPNSAGVLPKLALAAGAAATLAALAWGLHYAGFTGATAGSPHTAPAKVTGIVAAQPQAQAVAAVGDAGEAAQGSSEDSPAPVPADASRPREAATASDTVQRERPLPLPAASPRPAVQTAATALPATAQPLAALPATASTTHAAQPAATPRAVAPPASGEAAAVQPLVRSAETPVAVPPKSAPPEIEKRARELTPQQLAENEFRTGANLLNGARPAEAQERFRAALQYYPGHTGARQALFGVLLKAKNFAEAERVLHEALRLNARQPGFAMALARLQTERGDTGGAVETLQKSAPAAAGNADYLAFLGALLQRQERHAEAVDLYRAALAIAPAAGVWQMGLAISLQALERNGEAQDAYRLAKASNGLSSELQAFVDERLRQLQR